jgi:hypothetical protein
MPGSRRLKLRRPDECSVCGIALAAGSGADDVTALRKTGTTPAVRPYPST